MVRRRRVATRCAGRRLACVLARSAWIIALLVILFGVILARPSEAYAQTAIYHLHQEPSTTSGLLQLTAPGPDATSAALMSISLRSKQPGEFVIKEFDTQSGVPGASGVIPAGSMISFTLYMRKTADFGNMAPKAKVYLNNGTGPLLCTATSIFALTTTVSPFTFTCTTSSPVTMAASDRLYLWTGIQLTAKPGNNIVQAELEIEGTLDGATDSKIIVPLPAPPGPPAITSLSPSSGPVGTSVTISGTNFGVTQGSSTVTFNGTSASPASWSSTKIVVPVPAGATTGPVVVTVGGVASNGVTFTVATPPAISSLSPRLSLRGTPVTVNGSNFGSAQGASTVKFNGVAAIPSSWSDTAIVVPVPAGATTGPVIITVGGLASNGVTFTVVGTGAVTGTVLRGLDATPVSGAIVEALQSGVVKASTITASQGGYSLSSLLPGTYDVRVTAAGFVTSLQTGLPVGDYANTIVNFTLNSASSATTVLYHLHAEASTTTGLMQLKTNGPDTSSLSLYSILLKNKGTGEYLIQAFDTQTGIPNRSGTIPAGSTVSFTLGMRQTAGFGTIMPRAKLYLNNASGILLCTGTASSPLTTTLNAFTFTCATTANITMSASDRFYLWVGVNITAKPGNNSVQAELNIEGALNGTTDSHITVPLPSGAPALSSLSATSGQVSTVITIRGMNFGPTQGSSTVTWNGTAATPNSWNDTVITAAVPAGATTGPVVVAVGGVAGNGLEFYVDDLAPGVIATVAGTGTGGFSGDNGPATSAQLYYPWGVAMDGQNNLFIADYDNQRIRKVNGAGTITTVAGSNDLPLCCLDGVPAVQSYLAYPTGVAPDRWGNFYIADFGSNRIRKVDTSGIIWTVSTSCRSRGVIADLQGNLFFTCQSTVNKLDTAGVITQVANGLNNASGVAVDSRGNLFIADTGNSRIRKISPDGIITTVAGNGTAGFSGDSGPATAAQLNQPYGIAVDESGNLFIADTGNGRIRKVTFTGIITTVAGTGVQGYGGDGGAAINATFNFPRGIASIGQDVLFIGDASNNRVRKVGGGPFPSAPVISGVSTPSGAVGSLVTIFGSNFGAAQGSSVVTFNGVIATTTSWSESQIIATVPASASTGPLVVMVGSQTSNGVLFTVPLYINTISPTSGSIGTIVTVTGSGFGSSQGSSTLTFNGTSSIPTSWANAKIVVPLPSGATTGLVVVTVNGQPSNGITFTVILPPSISGLSPLSDPPDSLVTISGSNFRTTQQDSVVTFNSLVAAVVSWSETVIVARVPLNATTGPVVVTVGGLASNGLTFTVVPKITTLTPVSGTAGTSVTIAGSGFGATQGTSTVTFNGETAATSTWSKTSLVATVPPAATSGPVVVTVAGNASNGIYFSIPSSLSPVINSLSPQTGLIGTVVTITGSRFGSTNGGSTVTFNGIVATPSSWSDGSITARVPVGTTSGPVVVTVGGEASLGVAFTVLQISITYPITGMTLNKPQTVVYGTLPDVSGDVTVVVNGRYAMINGNSFAVNNIGLGLGQNTMTVTLTNQAGESATTSLTVQSDSQNAYVTLSAGLEMGVAPMNSTLAFQATLPSTITQIDLTFGSTDLGAVPFPYQVTMSTPGIYIATVTVQTANALSYQDQFALNALDHDALETLLRTTWTNMQTALLSGDINGAIAYFSSRTQTDYQGIFNSFQPLSIQQIFTTLEGFNLISVNNGIAEGEALRTENGTLFSYPVIFMLDETGTWRISSF
jgi:sugar lactone lactonase YvrE